MALHTAESDTLRIGTRAQQWRRVYTLDTGENTEVGSYANEKREGKGVGAERRREKGRRR